MKKRTYFIFLLFIISIGSCKNEKSTRKKIEKIVKKDSIYRLTNPKVNSEGAFLFKTDTKTVLSWTEWSKSKNNNLLKFAFFDVKSNKFQSEITVPTSKGLQMHAESMAKVGLTKKGYIYAIYRRKAKNRKSRFGGSIYYSISKDKGITWSKEQPLVTDKTSTSQSFFDIVLLSDDELGIIWLDSRKPIDKNHKGKTVYFAKTKLDTGFTEEKPIAGSTCECCRTEIYVDDQNTIHIAYRNLIDANEKYFDGIGKIEIRDMYYLNSRDNGKTFSQSKHISQDNWHLNGCPHTGPSLTSNGTNLVAVWYTGKEKEEGIYYALKSNTFSPKQLVTKVGQHPQMVSTFDNNYIVFEEYYEKLEKGYTKIVLKGTKNALLSNEFEISKKRTNNNHAVITAMQNSLLIAWVNKDTKNPKIVYKRVYLN